MKKSLAIIGGGVIGSMIAHLATREAYFEEITLIDMSLYPTGASLYSAGVHFPFGKNSLARDISCQSQTILEEMANGLPNTWFKPLNMIIATKNVSDKVLKHFTDIPKYHDSSVGSLNTHFKSDTLYHSVSGAHVANVPKLVDVLRNETIKNIEYLFGLRCEAIVDQNDKVLLQLTNGNYIEADAVIYAPGPWACDSNFKAISRTHGVRTKRVVALHIQKIPDAADPLIFMPLEDAFLLPQPESRRWLFSYTSSEWDVDPDTIKQELTHEDIRVGKKYLRQYCPELETSVQSGRVFCDAYSRSQLPIVASFGNSPRAILAGACNGSGYRFSPVIASQALELAAAATR